MFSFAPLTLFSSFDGFFFCVFFMTVYTLVVNTSHIHPCLKLTQVPSSFLMALCFHILLSAFFFIVLSDISPPQPQHTGCAILQNASSFPSNCAAGLSLSERWNEPGFVYATIQTMVGDCMCAGSIEKTLTIMRDERDGGEGTAMMSTNMGFFGVLSLFFPFKLNWNLWSFVALVFFQVLFLTFSALCFCSRPCRRMSGGWKWI